MLVTSQDGGTQQAQGNMQVLVNLLDLGANIQQAGDMARFSHNEISNQLTLESELNTLVGAQLAAMGHDVIVAPNGSAAGGFQGILFTPEPSSGGGHNVRGFYRGGSHSGRTVQPSAGETHKNKEGTIGALRQFANFPESALKLR